MKNYLFILLIIPALGLASGCADAPGAPRDEVAQTETGLTVAVASRQLPTFMSVNGRVAAQSQVEVATRMMARITAMPVQIGDVVQKGQVLVRLGSDDIEANRASAKAAVEAATLAAEEARRHMARMDTLLAIDAVPTVQRDQARLQLTGAESQLVMAQSALRNVETAASYSTIVAPFTGTVVSRYADPGDMAAPGVPLLVIQDRETREGRIAVPASVREYMTAGTVVEVSATGVAPVSAPVKSVSSGVDPMTGTVEIIVELPETWVPGTTLTAQLPVGSREGIAVPESSIVRRGQLTGVRVANKDGAAVRWVRLGRRVVSSETDEPQVEILSGLSAGEQIVL